MENKNNTIVSVAKQEIELKKVKTNKTKILKMKTAALIISLALAAGFTYVQYNEFSNSPAGIEQEQTKIIVEEIDDQVIENFGDTHEFYEEVYGEFGGYGVYYYLSEWEGFSDEELELYFKEYQYNWEKRTCEDDEKLKEYIENEVDKIYEKYRKK